MKLVVSDRDHFSPEKVPNGTIDGIIYVVVSNKSHIPTRHLLRDYCKECFITLDQVFVLPPIPDEMDIPKELLIGCSYIYDKEVMLYGDLETDRAV